MDLPEDSLVRLNLGAGEKRPAGYLNVGLEEGHDIRCDLRAIPVPDGFADEAMAIHVLEHFDRWDVPAVLLEWKRILKPGGLLVLELPDLLKCCRNVLRGDPEQEGMLGLFGDPAHREPLMMHRWGWHPETLRKELRRAGFVKVRERAPVFHGRRTWRDMRFEARNG
jgi:predicted SAM-dependent methyltransferase